MIEILERFTRQSLGEVALNKVIHSPWVGICQPGGQSPWEPGVFPYAITSSLDTGLPLTSCSSAALSGVKVFSFSQLSVVQQYPLSGYHNSDFPHPALGT